MTIAHSRTTHDDVDARILEDAAAHPERTYSEHIAAAERIAAEEYRRETRRLMDADMLDAAYTGLERL